MARGKDEVTVGAPRLKPKRKRVWLRVSIGFLIGVLVGVGGFYCYNNYYLKENDSKQSNSKKEDKKESNTSKDKELSVNSYDVEKLMRGIHFKDGSISERTLYLEDKTKAENLDSSYLENLLLKEAYRNKSSFSSSVSIEELEKARINLFGKNYEVVIPTDKEVGNCPVFNYNVENREYTMSDDSCSLTNDIEVVYTTLKAVQNNNYIYIYEVVAFVNGDGVYKKIDGSNNLSDKLKDVDKKDFDINKSKDDLNQYKYSFKYDSDTSNYVFESVELVK